MSSLFYALLGRSIEKANAWKKGFNKWDEEWEVGGIDNATGQNQSSSRIRSKNYIPVVPTLTYYTKSPVGTFLYFYGSDKSFLKQSDTGTAKTNTTFVIPDNARYMRFSTYGTYGLEYKNDICINISGEHNGEYVPYNG